MILPLGFGDLFGIQGFLILAVIGVLLYGERLPEVAADFGRKLLHVKKSLQGIRDEIESVAFDAKRTISQSTEKADEQPREEATAPKFEPPPPEPVEAASSGDAH